MEGPSRGLEGGSRGRPGPLFPQQPSLQGPGLALTAFLSQGHTSYWNSFSGIPPPLVFTPAGLSVSSSSLNSPHLLCPSVPTVSFQDPNYRYLYRKCFLSVKCKFPRAENFSSFVVVCCYILSSQHIEGTQVVAK